MDHPSVFSIIYERPKIIVEQPFVPIAPQM